PDREQADAELPRQPSFAQHRETLSRDCVQSLVIAERAPEVRLTRECRELDVARSRNIERPPRRRSEQLSQLPECLRSLMPAVRPEEQLEGVQPRSRVVLAPLCDTPFRSDPQVVDLHAKLVACFHHVLAEKLVGPRCEHPDVEARMALSRIGELNFIGCEALSRVLPEQLVQLEPADAGSPHE